MKSKKGLIIAIIAIVVLCALAVGGFCLWKFTNIFNFLKPADEVFSEQLEKTFNLEGAKFTNYSDFLNDYKEVYSKPSKSKLNMTAKLNISDVDKDTLDIINKSKITVESITDTKNQKSQNKIGLYSGNSEVLTLDCIANNGKIGIGCKDLSDKYLAVSTEDLLKYLKQNAKDLDAESLAVLEQAFSGKQVDPYELLYISEDDLKHFDDTYGNLLTKFISKDCYSSEKNVKVNVDGDEVKTSATYLTLTGKDAYKFVLDLANIIKDDEVVAKIITEKANKLLEVTGQNEKIEQSDVKDILEKFVDQLDNELGDIKDADKSAIQIALYADNTKTVRMEFNTLEDADKKDDKETLFSIEFAKDKNIYTLYNGKNAYVVVTDEIEKNSDTERKGKVTVQVASAKLGTLSYEFIDKDDETKIDLSIDVPLASVSARLNCSSKGDPKKGEVSISGLVSFAYGKESVEFNFDGTTEFTDNVSVPELNSSNSIDILKLSSEELNAEMEKIAEKAVKVLPARLKLLGIDTSKLESSLPSTVNAED